MQIPVENKVGVQVFEDSAGRRLSVVLENEFGLSFRYRTPNFEYVREWHYVDSVVAWNDGGSSGDVLPKLDRASHELNMIVESLDRLYEYLHGMSLTDFQSDCRTQDAVLINLMRVCDSVNEVRVDDIELFERLTPAELFEKAKRVFS